MTTMRELFRFPASAPSTELSAADRAQEVTDELLHQVKETPDSDEAIEIIAKIPDINQSKRLLAYRDIYESFGTSLSPDNTEGLKQIITDEAYSFISKHLDPATVHLLDIPLANYDDVDSAVEITTVDVITIADIWETLERDSTVGEALPFLIDKFAQLPTKATDAKLLEDAFTLSLSNGKSFSANLESFNRVKINQSEKTKSDAREQTADRGVLEEAARRDKARLAKSKVDLANLAINPTHHP